MEMMQFVIQDLSVKFRYLPIAFAAGILIALVCVVLFRKRLHGRPIAYAFFGACCFVILYITLLSRDATRSRVIDLELFSTWGINARNNAYVIENVLLFIPFGFAACLALPKVRNLILCALFGLAGSVAIEVLQLASRRGYFQVDDILTNVIGALIGWLLYWIARGLIGKMRKKR
jgi:glycopeptide antibiotics resistance protein